MTLFESFTADPLENKARALLSHVEAAAEREGLDPPAEAQSLADLLKRLESGRAGWENLI